MLNKATTFTLDPAQPIAIDLDRGGRGMTTVRASIPFRIGESAYAAGVPHYLHQQGLRGPQAVLRGVGAASGVLEVAWA